MAANNHYADFGPATAKFFQKDGWIERNRLGRDEAKEIVDSAIGVHLQLSIHKYCL